MGGKLIVNNENIDAKIYIYFDTNVLEVFGIKDYSHFQFSGSYYEIEKIIGHFDLQNKVYLIIPQIVIDEILKHYRQEYKKFYQPSY